MVILKTPLLGQLPRNFAEVVQKLQRLKQLLGVDSYNDMGQADEHRDELQQLEDELEAILKPQVHEDGALNDCPHGLREAWLGAVIAANDYAASVGFPEETQASCELRSFPHFIPVQLSDAEHQQAIASTIAALGSDALTVDAAQAAHKQRGQNLQRAHQLMTALRQRITDASGNIERSKMFALFQQLFPDAPLTAVDVDVVCTTTASYWALVSEKELADAGRDSAHDKDIAEWVKRAKRFRFEGIHAFPNVWGV